MSKEPHKDFLKPYDHNSIEQLLYSQWEKSGFFSPEKSALSKTSVKKSYSIIMPPPNANGSLHVGHAVMIALEDVMIRFARLRGKKTLWVPGADHAGFETQVVFEKKLEKEGTSRFEILKKPNGREKLYNMIWDFTQANRSHMENQIRQLGASCDWSRETFTLDKEVVATVHQTFKKLYDDGLVYRDKRLVNFCVKHQTSLSDLEISWSDQKDALYYVVYPFADDPKKSITIATVRPETIPGDVAIAVHPKDPRYKTYVGKEVIEPITKKHITVIADDRVDMDFGTGALKITPAHDATDFEIGKDHQLETIQTLDKDGRFNTSAGPLVGLKVTEARQTAVALLEKEGALERTEEYVHQVGTCYKCKNTLEPMVLDQWFIDLTSKKGKQKLVEPAIDAVKKGKIKILPAFQEKIFFHWMNNIRDWNISRQIVWGIQIPAWYKDGKQEAERKEQKNVCVGVTPPKGEGWVQETDVFDTWFSSGQWPYATLMASKKKKDFQTFYPTQVMETGYDILFFWVARMIMLGLYTTGKIPFQTVYLHGLVRDKDKQKMSKSKGNVVDPLGVVEEFGADALRMALIVGNSPGQDVVYDEQKIRGYRNFSNKLWNIARFVLQYDDGEKTALTAQDKKILKQCEDVKKKVAKEIEQFRFSQAAERAYHYVWHTFADKIIESKKKVLASEDKKDQKAKQSAHVLLYVLLHNSILMLHPFMPFVTEAIYQRLPKKGKKFLMVEEW